jgi:hypothetical protein
MAIQSNDTDAPTPSDRAAEQTFSSAPSSSIGTLDFLGLRQQIDIPSIDASVEPYLNKVMEDVKKYLPSAERVQFPRRENYFAVAYTGEDGVLSFFGIMFASTTDGVINNYLPTSMRMGEAMDELRSMYPGRQLRLVDQRVVLANYGPEMERHKQMADTILRAFNVTTKAAAKDAVISQIGTVEFSPDWSLANAKALADKLSPHGVRNRMDLGMVLRVKVSSGSGNSAFRDLDTRYEPIGVIGGYVEFKEKEPMPGPNGVTAMQYVPVFNITTLLTTMPLEGMAAVLIAALAPSVYNTKWWARQWTNFSKDQPNPGVLEMDPERPGHPYFVENQDDLLAFITNMCTAPHISYMQQDGRDAIPGLHRMFSDDSQEQAHFIQRLMHFFEADGDISLNAKLSDVIEYRFDGVYGDPSGALHDSREIDYLSMAARGGMGSMTDDARRTLLGTSDRPQDRAELISKFTGNYASLYLNTVNLLNPTFISWIADKIRARGLSIIDPNHQAEGRSFSSFTQNFGTGVGMGSVIQSGNIRPGLNLQSNWNRFQN